MRQEVGVPRDGTAFAKPRDGRARRSAGLEVGDVEAEGRSGPGSALRHEEVQEGLGAGAAQFSVLELSRAVWRVCEQRGS